MTKRKGSRRRRAAKVVRTETSTRTVKVQKVRKNPAGSSVKREMERAARLFGDFTGEAAQHAQSIKVHPLPRVMLPLGECCGIMYKTKRDGKIEYYRHTFKAHARPALVVSSDGRHLYLLGGAYRVTDRGIVDDA